MQEKYILRNFKFVFQSLKSYDKKIIRYFMYVIFYSVLFSYASIFLPKIVIDLISNKNYSSLKIILLIGGYTLFLAVINFLLDYSKHQRTYRNSIIQQGSSRDLFYQSLTCSYVSFENPDNKIIYSRLRENFDSNQKNAYIIYLDSATHIFISILGFFLYAPLLASLNIYIVILVMCSAFIHYIAQCKVKNYEVQTRDERAQLDKKLIYLFHASSDYKSGKEIRLYKMKTWFLEMLNEYYGKKKALEEKIQNKYLIAKAVNAVTVLLRDGIAYYVLIQKMVLGDITVAEFMLYFGAIMGFSDFITNLIQYTGVLSRANIIIDEARRYLSTKEIKEGNQSFKTTIINLLCGLYQPIKGKIQLDSKEINEYSDQELKEMFSVVFQDYVILPFTLGENVTADTEYTIEEVNTYTKKAGLETLVNEDEQLPNRIMTKIANPNGLVFSGGQTQKLLMARALYKDAPILILDEPTAALDSIAESEIYMNYQEFTQNKTSIFISHRLASTRFCDTIIFLKDGKIAEMGTHDELMQINGEYAHMYDVQSSYYREGNTIENMEAII